MSFHIVIVLVECLLTLSDSIQFNVASKKLGSERMSFYLRAAADDLRVLLEPELPAPGSKL